MTKENSMKLRAALVLFPGLLLALASSSVAQQQQKAPATPAKETPKEGVLKVADIGVKLFPDKVFFRGQVAPVQMRNTGGVRFSDQFLVMAGLVDNSGYSTGLREKYQAYLIAEVPIEIGGQTLKPGVYGFGFIEGNKFVVMDVGGNDALRVSSTNDSAMKRPVPLQFATGSAAETYRLYKGKDYVEFKRVK
jgi:hypothetical protein